MAIKAEILVVDEEPQLRKLLRVALTSYGYAIIPVPHEQEALALAVRQKPDMVVLDINSNSSLGGLNICRNLRVWSATPIIVLSSSNDKETKLAALNAGADDYVTVPFDVEELEARIRAILRRSRGDKFKRLRGTVQIRDLVLDLVNHCVFFKGDEIYLTPREYKLLTALATQPGKVLTFRTLAEELKGEANNPRSHYYVRIYINMLRKRLQDDPANTINPQYIFDEPEIGYRFADIPSVEDKEL